MSELIGILTVEESKLIMKPRDSGTTLTHVTYLSTMLPKVQEKALRILNILGLESRTLRAYDSISAYDVESFPSVDFSIIGALESLSDWETCIRPLLSGCFQTYISTSMTVRRGHATRRVVDVLCEISSSMIRFATRLSFTD